MPPATRRALPRPQQAIAAGADYLVVGRPVTAADDPARAAELFVQPIEEGLAKRTPASARQES